MKREIRRCIGTVLMQFLGGIICAQLYHQSRLEGQAIFKPFVARSEEKRNGNVHLIYHGYKFPFENMQTIKLRGFNLSNVITTDLHQYDPGPPVHLMVEPHCDGMVMNISNLEEACVPFSPREKDRVPKIYDLFLFNGEINMLKIRYEMLKDVVDHFVVLEAAMAFTGLQKELTLTASLLSDMPKIIYIPVRDPLPSFRIVSASKSANNNTKAASAHCSSKTTSASSSKTTSASSSRGSRYSKDHPLGSRANNPKTWLAQDCNSKKHTQDHQSGGQHVPKDFIWSNPWLNEVFLQEKLLSGLHISGKEAQSGDIILFSDVDEIIRPCVLRQLKMCGGYNGTIVKFDMKMNLYSYSFRTDVEKWNKPVLFLYDPAKNISLHSMRLVSAEKSSLFILNAGWHCTYCFQTIAEFQHKMKTFSHQEFRSNPTLMDRAHILRAVRNGTDLLNRPGYDIVVSEPIDAPDYVLQNAETYSYLLDRRQLDGKLSDCQSADLVAANGSADGVKTAAPVLPNNEHGTTQPAKMERKRLRVP